MSPKTFRKLFPNIITNLLRILSKTNNILKRLHMKDVDYIMASIDYIIQQRERDFSTFLTYILVSPGLKLSVYTY